MHDLPVFICFVSDAMDSFTFKNFVQTAVNLVEIGECDVDHISLITLIHAICEKLSGSSDCGLDKIVFELDDYFYIPTPPKEPQVLDVEGGYEPLGWEVPIVEEESVDGDDGITQDCMDGFKGYRSKSNDQYFTDSELEPEQVRIARLVKGNSFKRMVDGDGCGWRAHGSCMIDGVTFMIKTLLDHHDSHRIYNNKEAKVKWIASKFEKLTKSNPSIDVKVIGDLLRENYKVSVDMHKHYRAKHRALKELAKELAKEHANCFGYLRRYAYVLNQSNPGVATLYWKCHLKGPFIGVLLSAVSLDANSGLFTQDSWDWYCARHIYANFKPTYKGIINLAAKKWLEEIDPQHWSRFAYDPVIRCDHVINNMTEAFNSILSTHRAVSYLHLLEFIRRMVMRKFNERNEECRGWSSVLPPKVHAKILRHGRESRSLKMIAARNMKYELLGASGGYAVKLREYNLSGIPCCYAMATISHYCGRAAMKDKVAKFVHSSLTNNAYMQTYVGMILPIPDQKRWPEVPACISIIGHTEHMNPPPRTVQPGKPKK
ncbi:hypothetical protein EZV62_015429 [Acer yangbiense]|uniref:Uncharacterized protein n=1 Tax=Acer yangbiense TaxID=1000413 RepID=A0A5C7HKP2_9ROSI|nr:hypothetical protein EZV62_015429 [Acer yangbiense]